MKTSMQLRLSQHVAMTPQLQQAIRLLQLSTPELEQEIERALADNPLLERADDGLFHALHIGSDGFIHDTPAPAASSAAENAQARGDGHELGSVQAADDQAWDQPTDSSDHDTHPSTLDWPTASATGHTHDDHEGQDDHSQWAVSPAQLTDHLRVQLAGTHAADADRALVALLIEALDDNGYLSCSLEEIHSLLAQDDRTGAGVELEALTAALRLLQSFDPPGVGARNPAECLRLQIQNLLFSKPDIDQDTARLAMRMVSDHLPLLAAREFSKLEQCLSVSEAQLRSAYAMIRGLNPHPGVGFTDIRPEFIVPDVLTRRKNSHWMAELNPDLLPRLRVNTRYCEAVRDQRPARARSQDPQSESTRWSERIHQAHWFIKNVQQRFDTIARVAQAIIDRQQNFCDHGAIAMRPLVLREIAEATGVHESTVSRVSHGKYMATPHGVFEFKYFFGSALATDAGGLASSTAIRVLIKQMISNEDPRQPLSDSQIAQQLSEQGYRCARRTVAKYRELMQVPPVSQRRAL